MAPLKHKVSAVANYDNFENVLRGLWTIMWIWSIVLKDLFLMPQHLHDRAF